MNIELEQIFEGAYFLQEGNRIRIQADDFRKIPGIIDSLEPILVSQAELSMLRFSTVNAATGTMSRETTSGASLTLKPGMGSKWFLVIDDVITASYVVYIHQLQRVYFSLFEEHLRYSSDEIVPRKKSSSYTYKPEHKIVRVKVESTDPRIRRDRKGVAWDNELQTWSNEPYYLTADLRLLIRSKEAGGYAIWEIVHHSPLFTYAGKDWGLILAAGRTITQTDTENAGKWLKDLFSKSDIKFQ
jgi:hypothetical protein